VTEVKTIETPSQKVHHFPCPACGADLLYEPRDGLLTCPYCGHKEAIPQSAAEVQERSYEQYLHLRPEQMGQLASNALEVQCQSCGAKSLFVPPEVAGRCEFCGVQIVAQPKSADPIVSPEGLLPFRIAQKEVTTNLREWLSSRWFAPNGLKHFAEPEAIHGIYLPFWTYDTNTTTYYTGERGDYYYETEWYWDTDAKGERTRKSRQVRRTRWSPASGTVSRWFDDVLIPATLSVQAKRLHDLAPWDLTELTPYNPAFLSGFKAQRYQIDLAQGFELTRQAIAPAIESDVRDDIGGDEQRIEELTTHYSGITFKHLLLPVYAGAYRFKGKVFQIVVNGRTGEIQGDRPYSAWKIVLLVGFIALVIVILVLVFGQQ
jgi:DNA-directed RNA polymerase subunit RPC12/RpoP